MRKHDHRTAAVAIMVVVIMSALVLALGGIASAHGGGAKTLLLKNEQQLSAIIPFYVNQVEDLAAAEKDKLASELIAQLKPMLGTGGKARTIGFFPGLLHETMEFASKNKLSFDAASELAVLGAEAVARGIDGQEMAEAVERSKSARAEDLKELFTVARDAGRKGKAKEANGLFDEAHDKGLKLGELIKSLQGLVK